MATIHWVVAITLHRDRYVTVQILQHSSTDGQAWTLSSTSDTNCLLASPSGVHDRYDVTQSPEQPERACAEITASDAAEGGGGNRRGTDNIRVIGRQWLRYRTVGQSVNSLWQLTRMTYGYRPCILCRASLSLFHVGA